MTGSQLSVVIAIGVIELVAALIFIYKANIIEYVRQEMENENKEAIERKNRNTEDIDSLLENALRGELL